MTLNKKDNSLENKLNNNSNNGFYTVRTAPGYERIFNEVESEKDDPGKSRQLAAAYLKRTIFDLKNVFNFVNKLDNVAHKGQTRFDEGFKEMWFTLKYEIFSSNPKYRAGIDHGKEEKSFELNDEEIGKLFSNDVDDDQFSRDMAFKRENLNDLIGLTREQLIKEGVNVNLKYSFTEIRYTRYHKEFADKKDDELEKKFSENKNPIITRIIVRQKKGMRFVSKIDAKETGLDKVPLIVYKRLCEEKGNYYLESEILNKKRKESLIEKINAYLNNLLSNRDEYYKRKILEKFGKIDVTPLKRIHKTNINEIIDRIYTFLKETPNPENEINVENKERNYSASNRREQLHNLITKFNFPNIKDKKKEKIVDYITECIFPVRIKESNGNGKRIVPTLDDLIYPHLNIMLGTGTKGSDVNYDFLGGIKESKTDKIDSHYEKLYGDDEARICDRFGFTVLCARKSDMRKILKTICSHFGKNVYEYYVTNKKFDIESLKKGIEEKRNIIIEIKDYTVENKQNKFSSINGKMFYGGIRGDNIKPEHYLTPYIDYTQPTLIEFQIMTENMYKNSNEGDASHNTMRFLQALAIDIRNYNNRNNPKEKKRREDIKKRYLYVQ